MGSYLSGTLKIKLGIPETWKSKLDPWKLLQGLSSRFANFKLTETLTDRNKFVLTYEQTDRKSNRQCEDMLHEVWVTSSVRITTCWGVTLTKRKACLMEAAKCSVRTVAGCPLMLVMMGRAVATIWWGPRPTLTNAMPVSGLQYLTEKTTTVSYLLNNTIWKIWSSFQAIYVTTKYVAQLRKFPSLTIFHTIVNTVQYV